MDGYEFVLASASPRRKEILKGIGLSFDVVESDFDESTFEYDGLDPSLYVRELALMKAASAAKKLADRKNALIISADTVVCMGGRIFGKPADANDAYTMLELLSGKEHEVHTGVCVMRISDGSSSVRDCVTRVRFKKLTPEKITAYINTGEPMDKAGAYGIQGLGSMLTEGIDGEYYNVVGLPVSALSEILENDYNIRLL